MIFLTPMFRKCQFRWKGNMYFMNFHIGSILRFPTYYITYTYLKMWHVLCGLTYHPKRRTSYLPREILFLQILKRNIGQDKKIEERMDTLFHLKKVISQGFWRKKTLIWKRKLYWAWRHLLFMELLYNVASI